MNTKHRPTNPMKLGRKMKPTQKHRPAVWECMLGTVYAMNADREVRYFDYDWDAAVEYAGVNRAFSDPRTYRKTERLRYSRKGTDMEPRFRQLVLWVKDPQ